jgi:ribosomal protein L20A (L18A)
MYREYRDISINNAVETLCKFSTTQLYATKTAGTIVWYNVFRGGPDPLFFVRSLDNDMAGRHRSRNKSIQIIKTATVAAKDCKRTSTIQMHVSN